MFRHLLIATTGLALMAGPAFAQTQVDTFDPNVTVHPQSQQDNLPPELRRSERLQPLFQGGPLDRFVTGAIPGSAGDEEIIETDPDRNTLPENLAMEDPLEGGPATGEPPMSPQERAQALADAGPSVQPESDRNLLPENLEAVEERCWTTATGEMACVMRERAQ